MSRNVLLLDAVALVIFTPTELLWIALLFTTSELVAVALNVMPLVKPLIVVPLTSSAPPLWNRIPFEPAPAPSIDSPLRLTRSAGPAATVTPVTPAPARIPATVRLLIVIDFLIVT